MSIKFAYSVAAFVAASKFATVEKTYDTLKHILPESEFVDPAVSKAANQPILCLLCRQLFTFCFVLLIFTFDN